VSRVTLDTSPAVWRLTLRTPEGDQPIDLVTSLVAVEDGTWIGEVRLHGYPGQVNGFPVRACDWIQAHQMMLSHVQVFLRAFAKAGPLYWRGTDLPFEIPAWRAQRQRLRDRVRAWWVRRTTVGS
jgi:hypothetical protein